MRSNWNYPTTIWVGENRCKDLNTACENLHIINPLFVTDKDLINLPMVKSIILHLKKNYINYHYFQIFLEIRLGKMLMKELKFLMKINVMESLLLVVVVD